MLMLLLRLHFEFKVIHCVCLKTAQLVIYYLGDASEVCHASMSESAELPRLATSVCACVRARSHT